MTSKPILPRRAALLALAARALTLALGLAGVFILLGAGVWGWVHTSGGKRVLADFLASKASVPGFTVSIGALEGNLPFRVRLDNVSVADHKGRWLTAHTTTISFDPHALLEGRLEVGEVAVDRLDVTRPPLPEPESAASGAAVIGPVKAGPRKAGRAGLAIAVRRVAVDEVALGAALVGGEAAVLRAEGTAEMGDQNTTQRIDLQLGRRDGLPGVGHLHISYSPGDDILDLDLAGSEPEGGVMARALGLPGLPALAFNAIGVAPLADWHGRVTLAADGRAVVDIDASARRVRGGHLVAVRVGARPASLLPAPWADFAGPSPTLALDVLADNEGGLTLRPGSQLTLAAATIAASGSYDLDTNRLILRAATEPTVEAVAAVVPLPKDSQWKHASLGGAIDIQPGTPGPAFELTAEIDYLIGSNPLITRLAGPHLSVSARGTAHRSGELRLDAIGLGLAAGKFAGSGSLFPGERRFSGGGHLVADHLNRLLGAFGLPLNGVANLDFRLEAAGDHGQLDVGGSAASFSIGNDTVDPWLSALSSDEAKVKGSLIVDAGGNLHAKGWSLEGAHLTATGEGELVKGALTASAKISVPRLSDTRIPTLSGAATLTLGARGPLAKIGGEAKLTVADASFDGRRLGQSELELTATDLPTKPQVGFKLRAATGAPGIETVGAAGTVALSADGKRLSLSDLAVTQGANRAGGSVQVAFEGAVLSGLSGRLEGHIPALETVAPLLGQPVRGRARFEVDLGRENGKVVARTTVQASQVLLGAESPFAVADLELTGTASAAGFADFAAGRVGGSAQLNARQLRFGDVKLGSLTAGLTGTFEQASFQATAPGLDLAGTLMLGAGGLKLGVTKFSSQLGGVPVALGQPLGLDLAPGRLAARGLLLVGGGFHLGGDGALGPDGLTGRLALDRVPLELVHLFDPDVPAGGHVSGDVTFSGSAARPKAEIALKFADIGRAEADAAGFGVGGLDGKLTGRWDGGRLALSGNAAASQGGADLHFNGEGPLALRLRWLGLESPGAGALRGAVTGVVDLAAINDVLATSGDRVTGKMAVDVAVSGTPSAPQLGGTLTIEDARLESEASGSVIDHIKARLTGNGRAFTIESFSGTASNGGVVTVSGIVRPATEEAFDLRIKATEARLVQLDGATVDADADLTLVGGIREARLGGTLDIRRADIRLPDQLPAEVVDLQVEERANRPLAAKPRADAKPGLALGSPRRLVLALAVNAHNLVFIRGRGLDTEFGCALSVAGTARAPQPKGTLTMQRGKLDVLGKEFQFKRGTMTFSGGSDPNPELDLLAEAKATSITVEMALTGTVKAPKLVLTSQPAAPQDEVLSRLLFDKGISQLGALEVVQLADSASQLMGIGGSAGLVDRIRRTLGVDRLGVTSTGSSNPLNPAGGAKGTSSGKSGKSGKSSGLGSALEAGRYVSRDVYLGVQQGLTADSSRAKVEVGITDNIQAEVGVGVRADPQVGVKLQWDY